MGRAPEPLSLRSRCILGPLQTPGTGSRCQGGLPCSQETFLFSPKRSLRLHGSLQSTVLSSDYFLVKLTLLKPKESLRQVLAASLSAPNLLRLTASSGGESR